LRRYASPTSIIDTAFSLQREIYVLQITCPYPIHTFHILLYPYLVHILFYLPFPDLPPLINPHIHPFSSPPNSVPHSLLDALLPPSPHSPITYLHQHNVVIVSLLTHLHVRLPTYPQTLLLNTTNIGCVWSRTSILISISSRSQAWAERAEIKEWDEMNE
jgi:hypothetical protein